MAQIRSSDCGLRPTNPRPYLAEGFLLPQFTPMDKPRCLGKEFKRRNDVTPGQFGKGVPTVRNPHSDPYGYAEPYSGGFVTLPTEQGPIRLPTDNPLSWDKHYLPTTTELELAPYLDSRMPLISDRYFK